MIEFSNQFSFNSAVGIPTALGAGLGAWGGARLGANLGSRAGALVGGPTGFVVGGLAGAALGYLAADYFWESSDRLSWVIDGKHEGDRGVLMTSFTDDEKQKYAAGAYK